LTARILLQHLQCLYQGELAARKTRYPIELCFVFLLSSLFAAAVFLFRPGRILRSCSQNIYWGLPAALDCDLFHDYCYLHYYDTMAIVITSLRRCHRKTYRVEVVNACTTQTHQTSLITANYIYFNLYGALQIFIAVSNCWKRSRFFDSLQRYHWPTTCRNQRPAVTS
jgi:hypothetical protein